MAVIYLRQLIFWLGVMGFGVYALGLKAHLQAWLILPLCVPPAWYLWQYVKTIGLSIHFSRLGRGEKLILCGLIAQFALYAVGLFVPDTSFDALWYHLPLAQIYAATLQIARVPELLYSTMPRLGEMYFTLAFLTHSPTFVKLISFLFAILLILLSYHLPRQFLPRFWALLTAFVVNSLYVVAWQATAGYVDLTRAVFELAALLCLVQLFTPEVKAAHTSGVVHRLTGYRWLFMPAILTGFALSIKFQSLVFLVAISTFLFLSLKRLRFSLSKIVLLTSYLLLLAALTAAPWYFANYRLSGHPFYPLNLPEKQLDQFTHAGAASRSDWFINQTFHLPFLFWDLSINPAQQLTPLILILLPLVFIMRKRLLSYLLPLTSFICIYLFLWWFLPPPESRYLLSVIPPLIALEFYAVTTLPSRYRSIKNWVVIFALISVGLNYSLRLAASVKFLPLLSGRQTKEQYIDSQTTPFNRDIMQKYYSGYWQRYQYPN